MSISIIIRPRQRKANLLKKLRVTCSYVCLYECVVSVSVRIQFTYVKGENVLETGGKYGKKTWVQKQTKYLL